MRFIRYWILTQITVLLVAYLIDSDHKAEAKNFSQ